MSRLAAPTYYDIIKHPMDWATMGEKLDRHEYLTATDFADDVDLVLNNARRVNKPEHSIHKLAIKVHADAQPFLAQLESLDNLDSDATRRAAELAGALSDEYLEELFDFTYEPEPESVPEPESESVSALEGALAVVGGLDAAHVPGIPALSPVKRDRKGKGKVVPRDRNRKRTAAAAALAEDRAAISRASPRAKVDKAQVESGGPSTGSTFEMEGVEMDGGTETVEAAVSPEIVEVDENGLPLPVSKKPRRERSRTVTGPLPAPAHLAELAPRDTFKHFEAGCVGSLSFSFFEILC